MAWQLGSANTGDEWQLGAAVGTDVTTPTLLAGPTRTNVTPTSVDLSCIASEACTVRKIVDTIGSSEPSEATFLATGAGQAVLGFTPFAVVILGETQRTLRKVWIELKDTAGLRTVYSVPVLFPPTGFAYVELGALATAGQRITAVADLVPGDALAWGNISGAGTVVVTPAASFSTSDTVTTFDAVAGSFTDGWGATDEPQTLGAAVSLMFLSPLCWAPNQPGTLIPDTTGIGFKVRANATSTEILESGTAAIVGGQLTATLTSASGGVGDTVRIDAYWSQTIAGSLLRLSLSGDVTILEAA